MVFLYYYYFLSSFSFLNKSSWHYREQERLQDVLNKTPLSRTREKNFSNQFGRRFQSAEKHKKFGGLQEKIMRAS
jgi:hypothetical protein